MHTIFEIKSEIRIEVSIVQLSFINKDMKRKMVNNYEEFIHDYVDDDEHFMMEESILMEESIRWAYRPGRILVTSLYLDENDVGPNENISEQFSDFRSKNEGLHRRHLKRFIKSRGEVNQFRQDLRSTRQYMEYELIRNPNNVGLINFEEGMSWTTEERLLSLYIFKILTPYQRLNFREMIANPQMI